MKKRTVRRVVSRLESVVCEVAAESTRRPEEVFEVLSFLRDEPTEVFGALLLDGKHRITAYFEVSRGTLNSSLVHPREVFGPAVRMGAAALIVAHNHPSGDPEPSREDIEVTKRLVKAGQLLGIPLLDHVILGSETFVSLHGRI